LFAYPGTQRRVRLVRSAIVGVGTRAVIGGRSVIAVVAGTVVAVARSVIIGTVGAGDAGRECACRKAERQARPQPARLSRRADCGGANGRHRRQDCECLSHAYLLNLIRKATRRFCDGFSGYRRQNGNREEKKSRLGRNETGVNKVFRSSAATLPEVK